MSAEAHCKGCGLSMTEGRAYELGNHRWHTECFKCSKCQTQLTAHSSMLVLGDGRPVCTNCSYICVSCSKRITDMAVLTNDLSFCAACFVCRNCKKRIDDLQYARTSQGIFCMVCHNALLARKKQRQLLRQQQQQKLQQHQQAQASEASHPSHPALSQHRSSSNSPAGTPSHEKDSLLTVYPDPGKVNRHSVANSTSSSYDRNKDLPDLPPEIPLNSIDTSVDFTTLDPSKLASDASASSSTTSLSKKDARTLRVPRKQLAPSAFQSSDTNLAGPTDLAKSTSDMSLPSRIKDTSLDPRQADKTNMDLDFVVSNQKVLYSLESHEVNTGSDLANTSPWSHVETPTKTLKSRLPTPDSSRSLTQPGNSPQGNGLSIPVRSQLRPTSPARTHFGRSPSAVGSVESSPRGGAVVLGRQKSLVKSHQSHSPSLPLERHNLTSPTQAAAPQQTPKSPFSRWWSKRESGGVSGGASPGPSMDSASGQNPLPMASHKRSLSENVNGLSNGKGNSDPNDLLTGALKALALERKKTSELELQVRELLASNEKKDESQNKYRETLANELHQLEQQVKQLRDEYSMWARKTEHQKQLLERSMLESTNAPLQQPPPETNQPPVSKENTRDAFVPRKDDSYMHSQPASFSQAQFLPLKSAKQWFFRRPNKPGQSQQQQQHQGNGSSGNSYLSNNYSTDLSGETGNLYAGKSYNHANGSSSSANTNPNHNSRAGTSNSILGESLAYRVQIDQTRVPIFVTRCFREIETRGLDTEGIYRKPGSKSQVDAILEQFGPSGDREMGEELVLKGEIQAVTSAVKQYLRQLAEPVITYECYDAYIAAGNSKNVHYLKKAVLALPTENYATLKTVVAHLALVATHQEANLMNTRNLAVVFAPTLAREESGDREVPDMQARNEATQMLITNYDIVFESADDEFL